MKSSDQLSGMTIYIWFKAHIAGGRCIILRVPRYSYRPKSWTKRPDSSDDPADPANRDQEARISYSSQGPLISCSRTSFGSVMEQIADNVISRHACSIDDGRRYHERRRQAIFKVHLGSCSCLPGILSFLHQVPVLTQRKAAVVGHFTSCDLLPSSKYTSPRSLSSWIGEHRSDCFGPTH